MSAILDFVAPLFVPGDRPDRFKKAAESGADAVIVDLEDAVAAGEKDGARDNLTTGFTELPILVRVNAVSTPWHKRDLEAVCDHDFAAIMLPKSELDNGFIEVCEIARASGMPVVALIETAAGLLHSRQIAGAGGVDRLAFGSIDYCADVGCAHKRDALLFARNELVLMSRAAGITPPVDGVTTLIDDPEVIRDDARYARDLGFGGKLCIHPRQIAETLTGFAPDDREIEWARRVLKAGSGAAAVDGEMIDVPVQIRAQSILKRAGELQE